jgi:Protein NO VEIN, C-terminal
VPLVLTQNESTESGHSYADELGVEYEYPTRYRNRIRTGEPFVYYRGRRRADGTLQPQVYLGSGVVGLIRPSRVEGRLVCAIEDFVPFAEPLPFKDAGEYLEPLGKIPPDKAGLYFREGVREISDDTYTRILAAASAIDPSAGRRSNAGPSWASPETARLVDALAMKLALKHVRSLYAEAEVRRMPPNNPGYDIRIEFRDGATQYVEVKGTKRALPHFFMSEGERLFSHDHADRYTLLIVYAIDLDADTGQLLLRDGAVDAPDLTLRPVTWEGALADHLS